MEDDFEETSFTGHLAWKIILISFHVYMFTYMCTAFSPCVIRKLAHVFQLIRLFLIWGAILPCLLHRQLTYIAPEATDEQFPLFVAGLLVGNMIMATLANSVSKYFYNKFNPVDLKALEKKQKQACCDCKKMLKELKKMKAQQQQCNQINVEPTPNVSRYAMNGDPEPSLVSSVGKRRRRVDHN